jgi:hypothetical protein
MGGKDTAIMEEKDTNFKKDLEYQVYLDERKLLIDAERESSRSLDKAILTLAAGALGLSLTFLRQIVPDIQEGTLILVILAWGFFSLSILITLISLLTSQWACKRQRDILEGEYLNPKNCGMDAKNIPAICTKWLNISGIVTFMIGVVFLASFSIINLREDTMVKENVSKSERGFVPPKLPKLPRPGGDKEAGFVPPGLPKKPLPVPPPKDEK